MTTSEAIALLVAADPGRTFIVNKSLGYHAPGQFRAVRTDVLDFNVSAVPGYDGSRCQLFSSKEGFDKPVADFVALAKSVEATENKE